MIAKAERNAAIVAMFVAGESLARTAEAFGTSASNVRRIIGNAGALPEYGELVARFTAANRRKAACPAFRAQQSERMRAWWRERRDVGQAA